MKQLLNKSGFSLVEVLLGIVLLASAIVIVAGVIISSLQSMKKSEALLDATNILVEEKGKIDTLGYNVINKGDSYQINTYYVIYNVTNYDYGKEGRNEIKVVSLKVSNVPEKLIPSCPKDRLIYLKTELLLYYKSTMEK
jgi:prepilin-type N-terminal cleavage/methylation domain-containing protein